MSQSFDTHEDGTNVDAGGGLEHQVQSEGLEDSSYEIEDSPYEDSSFTRNATTVLICSHEYVNTERGQVYRCDPLTVLYAFQQPGLSGEERTRHKDMRHKFKQEFSALLDDRADSRFFRLDDDTVASIESGQLAADDAWRPRLKAARDFLLKKEGYTGLTALVVSSTFAAAEYNSHRTHERPLPDFRQWDWYGNQTSPETEPPETRVPSENNRLTEGATDSPSDEETGSVRVAPRGRGVA